MRHFNKSSLLPVLRIASGTNLLHIEQFAFYCWEELPTRGGGGVTPVGAVSRAVTGFKIQSNGQGTLQWFSQTVKQCAGVLSLVGDKEAWIILCACTDNPRLRHGQAVKAIFRRSKS